MDFTNINNRFTKRTNDMLLSVQKGVFATLLTDPTYNQNWTNWVNNMKAIKSIPDPALRNKAYVQFKRDMDKLAGK